jgi:hypothetical protein
MVTSLDIALVEAAQAKVFAGNGSLLKRSIKKRKHQDVFLWRVES